MPKVSVVIPTYNYGRFLGEAIQSVLDQTYQDFEIFVVDDGSTDNTKEVVISFKDHRIKYVYKKNSGVSAARNTGICASDGEYIAFLDSDDTWLPQNLELKVKLLDSHPKVALVCSDSYVFDNLTGATLGRLWHDRPFLRGFSPRRASQHPLKEMLFQEACFIRASLTMVRRVVFTKVGYFDESLRTAEDWDMFVRIVQQFPIETIDIPLGRRRKHGAALTASWAREYPEALNALNKAIRSYSLSNEELTIAKRTLARIQFAYGREMIVNGRIAMGREKLLVSIRVNPWCIRPYIYLAGSFLGSGVILTLKSWKKRLERHFVRCQPSSDAKIIDG
jgi:glycosyltransferase involved in cell wall biosynthesis